MIFFPIIPMKKHDHCDFWCLLYRLDLIYNYGRNVSNKLYFSGEIPHFRKVLISIFLLVLKRILFWEKYWVAGYNSRKVWDFYDYS